MEHVRCEATITLELLDAVMLHGYSELLKLDESGGKGGADPSMQ